jgi:hypothetical protein
VSGECFRWADEVGELPDVWRRAARVAARRLGHTVMTRTTTAANGRVMVWAVCTSWRVPEGAQAAALERLGQMMAALKAEAKAVRTARRGGRASRVD